MDKNQIKNTPILPNRAIRKTFTKFISIILIEIHLFTVTFNGLTYEDIADKFDLSSLAQELFSAIDDLLVKKCFADFDPPQSATFQAGSLKNFQADLFTGAAKYSLPIVIPQGRAGIQPNLSLNYFSNSGNSWCGVGWNLVIPSISRSTKWGVPKYNSSDTFIYASGGSQIELVNIGGNEYRTKIEGEFVKLIFDGTTWQMFDKSGKRYFFGSTDSSRQTNPSGTFKWCLDKVIDSQGPSLNGNYMLISYFKDQGQIYPEQIRYTGNEDKGDSHHQTVDFIREARTDIPSSFITGYSVVTAYRLKEIDVKVDGNRLRKYVLNYIYSSKTNRSLLNSFIQYGSDGVTSLPATSLTYQDSSYTITSGTNWLSGPATNWPITGDFNGDALTDSSVYIPHGNLQIGLSNGVAFNSLQTWLSFSHEWSGNYGFGWSPQSGDFNGDGFTDILGLATWLYRPYGSPVEQWIFHSRIEVSLSNGTGLFPLSIWRQEMEVPFLAFGRIISLADFNGDGLTDLGEWYGTTQKKLRMYFSNGNQFIEQGYWINNLSYTSTTQIFGGDFNGDGLGDIGRYNDGNWDVALGTGSSLNSLTNWLTGFGGGTNKVATVIDVNNDGLTDAVLFDKDTGNWQVAISDGTHFIIQGDWITGFGANKLPLAGDFDGDGIIEPGYFDKDNGIWQIADTQGTPYDLLKQINNGMGGSINISYAPSPHNTSLPFTVQTVSSVITQDGLGNSYTANYQYQNGLYDAGEREFRGFGYVKSTDGAGNYSESLFWQDDIFKGRIREQRSFDSQGNPYTKTINSWQSTNLYPGVDFVYLAQVDSYSFDGNLTGKRVQTQFSYDSYGNNIQTIELGEVDLDTGNDIGQDKRTTFTEYAYNTANWLLKFPKHTYVQNQDNTTVKQSWFYYDGNSNLDDPPIRGNLTKQENWLDGGTNPFATFTYDDYGNIITSTNANNRTTTTTYDSTYHMFPVLSVNPLGHQTSTQYYGVDGVPLNDGQGLHGLWGQAKSTTDPNDITGYTTYDVFGRVEKLFSALDSIDFPTASYEYYPSSGSPNPSKIRTYRRENSGQSGTLDSVSFYDGLGRLIQTKIESEQPDRYIVSGQTEYNSRGLPEKKYLPKFSTNPIDAIDSIDPTDPHATITYDALGRVIQSTNPDGTHSNIIYDDWITTTIDENGHKQVSFFDAYGLLFKKEEFTGADGRSPSYPISDYTLYATTLYSYDTLGNLIQTQDNSNNITTMEYDTLGRKIAMTDPDMGHWVYEYDAVDNLVRETDAKNQVTNFQYDALNCITLKDYSGAQQDVIYTYDDPLVANSKGRLTKSSYGSSDDIEFRYNVLGQETQTTKKINNINYNVQRSFDALERLSAVTYPDGEVVNYGYNTSGQIETVASSTVIYVTNVDYNIPGQITKIEYGNNTKTYYHYNPQTLRLDHLKTFSPSVNPQEDSNGWAQAQGDIQDLSYTCDSAGNILQITDAINPAHSQEFAYDSINRLALANGVYGYKTYAYNEIGNITSKDNLNFSYADNAGPHAVTSLSDGTTFNYDVNGNMIRTTNSESRTTTYEYDFENRLKQVFKDSKFLASFQYDGDGGRTKKTIYPTSCGGSASLNQSLENRRYVFEFRSSFLIQMNTDEKQQINTDNNLKLIQLVTQNTLPLSPGINELALAFKDIFTIKEAEAKMLIDVASGEGGGGGGGPAITLYVGSLFEKEFAGQTLLENRKHIFSGSQRICTVTNNSIKYFHTNHLGSTDTITDNNGQPIVHYEYSPYGEIALTEGGDSTDFKFTGKLLDDEIGLYYYGARYYNPQLGRFITPDSYIQDASNPQTFNRYSYCGNNPVNYIDPSGNSFWGLILAILGWIAGISTVISIAATIAGMVTQQQTFFRIAQISGYIGMAAGLAAFVGNSIQAAIAAKGTQLAEASIHLDTIVITPAETEAYRNAIIAQQATQAAEAAAGAAAASAASTVGSAIFSNLIEPAMNTLTRPGYNYGQWIYGEKNFANFFGATLDAGWAVTGVAGAVESSMGAVSGRTTSFYQYYGSTSKANNPWLTKTKYSLDVAMKKLSAPRTWTDFREVKVPWNKYVAGPRPVAPKFGQPGLGLEYKLGGFKSGEYGNWAEYFDDWIKAIKIYGK